MNKSVIYGIVAVVVLALLAWGAMRYADRAEAPIEEGTTLGDENAQVSGGCYVGGCSSQICSDEPGVMSTCEFRQEYSCYQNARCERQGNGECGWTETSELVACLSVNTEIEVEMGK